MGLDALPRTESDGFLMEVQWVKREREGDPPPFAPSSLELTPGAGSRARVNGADHGHNLRQDQHPLVDKNHHARSSPS